MKLPARVRYAVRAMVELAARSGQGPVPVKVLAEAQGLSPKYVKQLMSRLHRENLVTGRRGNTGGYLLARDAEKITALDIHRAMGEGLSLAPCVGGVACRLRPICSAGRLWTELSATLAKQMGSVTIGQLAARGSALASKSSPSGKPGSRAKARREETR